MGEVPTGRVGWEVEAVAVIAMLESSRFPLASDILLPSLISVRILFIFSCSRAGRNNASLRDPVKTENEGEQADCACTALVFSAARE
jgi:hypothetical protein